MKIPNQDQIIGKMTEEEEKYKAKIVQRHKNYVEYYELIEPTKYYSLSELMAMGEMELLNLIPQNKCLDEYSEVFGYYTTKYSASFKISKIIDGSWSIGYYEGHRDKTLRDQRVLFEINYVKDLKIGLIDLFFMVQNNTKLYYHEIKLGKRQIGLDDSWDDRIELGLDNNI